MITELIKLRNKIALIEEENKVLKATVTATTMSLAGASKRIEELESIEKDYCEKCGCTEFLCGHNKRG